MQDCRLFNWLAWSKRDDRAHMQQIMGQIFGARSVWTKLPDADCNVIISYLGTHWCQIRIGLWVSRLVLPQIARKKNIIFRRRKNENWSRNWAMGGIINSLELHLWDAAVAAVQWHIAMGVAKVPRGCISRERCGDGVWSASSYLTFEAGIIAGYMNALYALHHIVLGFWPKKMQSSSLWDKLNVQPVLKMDEVDPKQLHKAFYIGVNIFYYLFHSIKWWLGAKRI